MFKHITSIGFCTLFPLMLSSEAALAQSNNFRGIFVGDHVPGAEDCRITEASSQIFSRYGTGTDTNDTNLAGLYSDWINLLYEDVRTDGLKSDYDAYINLRIDVSQSSDFVTESGKSWTRQGQPFFAEGMFIAIAYFDRVKLSCPE
jgi:hypothetical protein